MAQKQLVKKTAILLVIGLMLVGNAVWSLFLHPTDLDTFTSTADGTIVSVSRHRSNKKTYYCPTISFADSDHRTFRSASVVEYTRRPKVGDKVTVRYDPRHPGDGCVIEGDEGRLHKKVVSHYFSLAGGVAIMGWAGWSYVRERRLP